MIVITDKKERIVIYENGVTCGAYKKGSTKGRILRNLALPQWAVKGMNYGKFLVINDIKVLSEDVVVKNKLGKLEKRINLYVKVIGELVKPRENTIDRTYVDTVRTGDGLVRITKTWQDVYLTCRSVSVFKEQRNNNTVEEILISRKDIEAAEAWCRVENAKHLLVSTTREFVEHKIDVDTFNISQDLKCARKGDVINCDITLKIFDVYKDRIIDNSYYVAIEYSTGTLSCKQKSANYLTNQTYITRCDNITVNVPVTCVADDVVKTCHRDGDCGDDGMKMGVYSTKSNIKHYRFDYNGERYCFTLIC